MSTRATSLFTGGGVSIFGNQGIPRYISGSHYMPPGYYRRGSTVTTTADRCYYVPFAIQRTHTFQGAVAFNQSAGDSGELFRIMMFYDDAVAGGPGTLAKDFGQGTLTAASSLRTLSSSWDASPGLYWAAIWFNSATAMYGMLPYMSSDNVGAAGLGAFGLDAAIGTLNADANMDAVSNVHAHYVGTAYGSAPASAVAATASLVGSALTATAVVPAFALKA